MSETKTTAANDATVVLHGIIQPGVKAWVINEYLNSVSQKTVKSIETCGVRIEESLYPVPFTRVFQHRDDAIRAMVARAKDNVANAERGLRNAKATLAKLTRKHAAVLGG